MTQRELADAIGVPSLTISRWERGANAPTFGLLVALANALGCSLDALVAANPPAREAAA